MKINYNATGEKRKSLAVAVSRELNAPMKYLGAPTFAYEVGGYRIDKNGMLEGEDKYNLVTDLCGRHSFKATSETYDTPIICEESLGGMGAVAVFINLNGEAGRQTNETSQADKSCSLVIEMPRDGFTDATIENLKRLVESKATLMKRAFGITELPIELSEEAIRFPWFTTGTDTEAVKAYTHFVAALCETAKTQHRVSGVDKAVENQKYAFRCFLLRLGFIGPEYKTERKILLSNLSGSSAFRNPTAGGVGDE